MWRRTAPDASTHARDGSRRTPCASLLAARIAAASALLPPLPAAAQQADTPAFRLVPGMNVRRAADGVLSLLGYAVVPDGTASAIQINRGGGDDDIGVTLGQIGAGFTWSDSFPLYLEGFIGYARYDPLFVVSDGQQERRIPTRWNNVAGTIGVGWDFRLARNLYLRPIVNGSLGYIASDASLFGSLVEFRTNREIAFLESGSMTVWGGGGSLVLAYYDHLPAREIDVELRYTHIHLEPFGRTGREVGAQSEARTANLWARLRWPTGAEVFGRPLRYVLEAQHSIFFDAEREPLGFDRLTKVGGGLELDAGALEIGALGLYVQRVRLLGRYVFGNNVQGFSVGLGISF